MIFKTSKRTIKRMAYRVAIVLGDARLLDRRREPYSGLAVRIGATAEIETAVFFSPQNDVRFAATFHDDGRNKRGYRNDKI
jgi:hypothetical protein